jgi:hypothetical protein
LLLDRLPIFGSKNYQVISDKYRREGIKPAWKLVFEGYAPQKGDLSTISIRGVLENADPTRISIFINPPRPSTQGCVDRSLTFPEN